MKIKNFLAMMLIALCVVACSDDDETISPAQAVATTYSGYSNTYSDHFTGSITENEKVVITANEDGTGTIIFTSNSYGITTISAATVTSGTDGYTISGTGTSKVTGMTGTTGTYECKLTGTISTDKSDVKLVFSMDFMGTTVATFYLGDAPLNLLVAGSYDSYSVGVHNRGVTVSNGESIKLTANTEDGKVNLAYSGQWGTGTANGITVTKSNGSYTVSGSGTTVIGSGHAGSGNTYEFTVEGTISEDKSTVSFVFTIEMGSMGSTGNGAPVKVTTNLGDAPAAMMIAKTYTGTIDLSTMGSSQGSYDGQKVTIEAQADGKITVNLAGFGSAPMGFGDMAFENIEVTVEDDIYTLAGDIDTTYVNSTGGNTAVVGSLRGTIEGSKANIVFTLTPGLMPMPLTATFVSE